MLKAGATLGHAVSAATAGQLPCYSKAAIAIPAAIDFDTLINDLSFLTSSSNYAGFQNYGGSHLC